MMLETNWFAIQPETFFDATEWTCTEVQAGAENHAGYFHPSGVGASAFKLAYTAGQHRDHRKVQAYNWVGQSSVNIDLDVMLLSDVGHVTEPQAVAIRQFVSAGGGLIATGQTSLIGEDGKPMADFALADVLGVTASGDPAWDIPAVEWGGYAYLDFAENAPWWGDAVQPSVSADAGELSVQDTPWLGSRNAAVINSPFQMVQAAPGAVVEAFVGSTDVARPTRYPGIVTQRYGKGRVVYIAPRLGEIYARYPYPMWQRVLRRALDRVTPRPAAVEVTAPQCVTAYSWEQTGSKRWIVHLINDLDETGRPRGRMGAGTNHVPGSIPRTATIPVDGITVVVRKPGATRASLPLEGKTLAVAQRDGALHIQMGRLEQHALIVVE